MDELCIGNIIFLDANPYDVYGDFVGRTYMIMSAYDKHTQQYRVLDIMTMMFDYLHRYHLRYVKRIA